MDSSQLSIVRPPQISSRWLIKDYLGSLQVRLSIGRGSYRIKPGLYRLGEPDKDSDVLVSANYKLSFDLLRKNLEGMDVWILVLETYGINVWCAAGKGTFGSDELIRRIKDTQLEFYVNHRRLIVPQLGAPGVSAPKVKKASGFSVKFGPVRASDLKEYLDAGYKKDLSARTVKFRFKDRLILTGVELSNSLLYLLVAIVFFALLSGVHSGGYSLSLLWRDGLKAGLYILAAYFGGAFLAPLMLPVLPFRQFGGKGLVIGMAMFGLLALLTKQEMNTLSLLAWFFISGAISSYLTMNFTGASTYTSLSGVRKEMGIFVPIQLVLSFTGLTLLIISKLI